LKIEKTTIANKPFLDAKIVATNTGSRRIRGIVLSSVSTKFAFLFGISAILLLPSLLVISTNQSAWAGTFPGPNGQIAFSSNRDGNFEIYTMNDDGSDVTRLTEDDANDFDPSWSPDGDKIAFVSFRDGSNNMEIYVMDADGSDPARLTDNDADDREPDWGTNTSTPGDDDDGDDDKNKHDSKKKHHDDNAKKKH
jgi:dipeptidyl aminopeptidase/acylaminoacyl peptidase